MPISRRNLNFKDGTNTTASTADNALLDAADVVFNAKGVDNATIWDTKGDLAVATGADAAAKLPVGSNGQVLTADSAQTTGVKWATPAASGAVATDAIWDTKGDLAVATGADAASKLAVGSDGQVLTADSTQTTGLKWAAAGGGGGAWTLLSTTTLGSDNTFDISSISGSYNDLLLVLIGRLADAAATDNVQLRLNNDSGSNYGVIQTLNSGTVSANEYSSVTQMRLSSLPANGASGNAFGFVEMLILGYASTTWNKVVRAEVNYGLAVTAGNKTNNSATGYWASTAAVNRVTLFGQTTSNFKTGSVLRIYGRT